MESFLSGRKSVSSGVQQSQPREFQSLLAAQPTTEAGFQSECGLPKIEAVQGPNGVERIIVTCECGKRIEVVCHYD